MNDSRRPLRLLARGVAFVVTSAVALALAAVPAAPLRAADGDAPGDSHACVCVVAPGSGACQHFLRTPKKPIDDPCWCPQCRDTPQHHDGKSVPKGWNQTCFLDKGEENYLKRHACAFGITCSDCLENDKTCKATEGICTACSFSGPSAKDYAGRPARKAVVERITKERRFFKDPKAVRVLYTKDFYLVTDVPQMKVATGPTTWRMASGHEWAHVMMERAEYARREFVEHLGPGLTVDKPTGMYIPVDQRSSEKLAGTYLGNETANILYGGSDQSTVADGFCFHGFVISMEKFGDGGDLAIHFAMRHMIGHELISCWTVVDGHNRALPRWLHVGTAHWLSRLQPRFREDAFACNLEGQVLELPGKKWDKEVRRIATQSRTGSLDELLVKNAQGQLTADDHRRAWSYMDLCLSEWRTPFVNLLRALRKRVPAGDAWQQNLGMSPEQFDQTWRQRVLDKLSSMDPEKARGGGAAQGDAAAALRAGLRESKDPANVAARIRGLGTISDPATAAVVVDLLGFDHALVRETALVALLAIEDAAARDAAWKAGLAHQDAVVRAYSARLCAARGVTAAIPALRKQIGDSSWYPRAEAALALGALHDDASLPAFVRMLDDSADKAQVAALDALASLGPKGEPACQKIGGKLSSARWQVRVAASQSLGAVGSMEGVEPLIARMEVESGRVRRDIQDALKAITHDDLGRRPENWRAWWEKQKEKAGGKVPPPSDAPGAKIPDPRNDPNSQYADPRYFGIELFGDRIAFVLDSSASMQLRFVPSAEDQRARGRPLRGSNKLEISKSEITESLKSLDPRAYFNVIAFSDAVDPWKKNPVPASRGNVDSAISWVEVHPSGGETNYYDALRAVLDIGDKLDASPDLGDTPDTIPFLTDGMPTRGAITDPKTILHWDSYLNRYARVTTHVIAFGDKGLEVELLRALAERNFGTFVHVHGQDK